FLPRFSLPPRARARIGYTSPLRQQYQEPWPERDIILGKWHALSLRRAGRPGSRLGRAPRWSSAKRTGVTARPKLGQRRAYEPGPLAAEVNNVVGGAKKLAGLGPRSQRSPCPCNLSQCCRKRPGQ